ncbi:nucleotidyltransferase domain-containing protein [Xanthomonas arboricola]
MPGKVMDQPTIDFVKQFCTTNITCGLKQLYLIGSQAKGTARPNSDHDFIAVISDDCPSDLATGRALWTNLYNKLDAERRKRGLGPIDLFIKHSISYASASSQQGNFPNPAYDAVTYGIKVSCDCCGPQASI